MTGQVRRTMAMVLVRMVRLLLLNTVEMSAMKRLVCRLVAVGMSGRR